MNGERYYNKGLTVHFRNLCCRKIKEQLGDSIEISDLSDHYDVTLSYKENLENMREVLMATDPNDGHRQSELRFLEESTQTVTNMGSILNILEKVIDHPTWNYRYQIKIDDIKTAIENSRHPKKNKRLWKKVKRLYYRPLLSKNYIFITGKPKERMEEA